MSSTFLSVPASPKPNLEPSRYTRKLTLLFESEAIAKAVEDTDTEDNIIADLRLSLLSAGYKVFDGDDLALCSCLNSGYLLRLSLAADFRGLAPISNELSLESELFGGVVAVFYRGYGSETTTGRLIPQKIDYLQTNLLQSFFSQRSNRTRATIQKLGPDYTELYDNDVEAMSPYVVEANATAMPCEEIVERVSIADLVGLFSQDRPLQRILGSLLTSSSTLKEPTYDEVIVIHRPLPSSASPAFSALRRKRPIPEFPSPIEAVVFSDVPLANVVACLPKSKLVFRIADGVRFDLLSFVGLLAVGATTKLDSPTADLIAAVSVAAWAIRLFVRYSNSLARYDLLVNRFLKSKIVRRGLPAVHKYVSTESAQMRGSKAGRALEWILDGEGEGEGEMEPQLEEGLEILKSLGIDENMSEADATRKIEERWKAIFEL
ncbi:hypothetical protein TrST_g4433 [Triparma strigata]|uniref:Uncharacterized protein n=1 Tax=Triparma strigata TaxID=1606541 RepID=A0A9W7EZW9_9STRA|nr:hypothetical protein TrST_g4433 [Triparma strigata]